MKKHLVLLSSIILAMGVHAFAEDQSAKEARLAEIKEQIMELKAEARDIRHELDDMPVYENDVVRVWFDEVGEPEYDWYTSGIKFIIENKADYSIEVSASELSIDGFMVDESFINEISPGKKLKAIINVEDPDWTIDKVKDITLGLVYNKTSSFDFTYTDVFELD